MKADNLLDIIGDVDENFIAEAKEIKKVIKLSWAKWIAVAASLCIITTMVANSFGLITYAKSWLSSFGLDVGTLQIESGEMLPIEFDLERFKRMPNVQPVQGSNVADNDLYVLCEDAEELQACSGIILPSNGDIIFKNIGLHISGKKCNGHLSMDIVDNKVDCIATMNGQFILEGNENKESLGYGYELGKVKSTYKCDNGTEAYILKDKQSEDKQIVIFTVGGVQYQLFVDNTKEGTAFAKSVVDLMCD